MRPEYGICFSFVDSLTSLTAFAQLIWLLSSYCRYAGPIGVAELMWVFDQTHTSINAATATTPGQQMQAAEVQ